MSKPKPIITAQECDTCGLDWDLHPENPTKDDCIRLLKEHQRPIQINWPEPVSRPYPVPYPVPTPYPVYPHKWVSPYWDGGYGTWMVNGNTSNVIEFTSSNSTLALSSGDDDDPDMGVVAKVS